MGDFDGVGFSELGVYRPGTQEWYVAGHGSAVATYGSSTDIPASTAYGYRALPGSVGSVDASSSKGLDFGANALTMSVSTPAPAASPTSVKLKRGIKAGASGQKLVDPGLRSPNGRNHVHDSGIAPLLTTSSIRRKRGNTASHS